MASIPHKFSGPSEREICQICNFVFYLPFLGNSFRSWADGGSSCSRSSDGVDSRAARTERLFSLPISDVARGP